MRDLRGTYVRRGDRSRKLERTTRAIAGIFCCTAILMVYENQRVDEASAARAPSSNSPTQDEMHGDSAGDVQPSMSLGELAMANAQLERWNRIFSFSNRYNIGAQLAGSIHDIALDEGIEPELAFRLVRVESEFKEDAVSPVGAVGLTQLMPATARYFEKGITRERLHDRETNLRIGFRYLRGLIREYDGNLELALLVYNRGPTAVERSRRAGIDPSNGYERKLLRGYTGDGVVN